MRSGFPSTYFGELWDSAHHIKKGTQEVSDVEGKLVKGFRR